MTVTSSTALVSYEGGDSIVEFPVTFGFIANSHIKAILRDSSGSETTWVLDTDYTLTGAGGSSGTLTATTAPDDGETLVIKRDMPFTQDTDYVANDPFPAEIHEQALDELTMNDQQLKLDKVGTIRISDTVTDSPDLEINELAAGRASKHLAFDGSGDLVLITPGEGSDILNENDFSSESQTQAPSQNSVKEYFSDKMHRKNLLINGNPSISQRGTYTTATAVTNGSYYLDRWQSAINTITGTVQQLTTSQPSGATFAGTSSCKLVATSTATGFHFMQQTVENGTDFASRQVTFSAWVKSNSTNARLIIGDGLTTSVSSAHTGGGAWEQLSVTATISASPTLLKAAPGLCSATGGTVALTNTDYIEFTEAQLELGSTVTDFEYRSYAEELVLAQRYCYVGGTGSVGEAYSTTAAQVGVKFPVTMYGEPTVHTHLATAIVSEAGIGEYTASGGTVLQAASSSVAELTNGCAVNMTGFTGLTTGATILVYSDNCMRFEAEL